MSQQISFDHTNPGVIDHVLDSILPEDYILKTVRQNCHFAGLPAIEVSAQQGRQLELLVATCNARRVLEIGTLGAYSTICLARGVGPGGTVITLEYEPKHVDIAIKNLEVARVRDRVVVVQGSAWDTLPKLQGEGPFDFVFIDADKENNAVYLDWAADLLIGGGVVLVDNVIRDGRVIATDRPEKLEFIKRFSSHPAFKEKCVIQTVGTKGWDGFALARKW
jgi:predicted O-methyltransferase YrrM